MPDKTTPESPGLYLKVVSDAWEERCPKWEQGKGRECDHLGYVFGPGVGALGCTLQVHGDYSCSYNTGARRVRLVGWMRMHTATPLWDKKRFCVFGVHPDDDREAFYEAIAESYRNKGIHSDWLAPPEGTGPEWGLRIEEVQDDAR